MMLPLESSPKVAPPSTYLDRVANLLMSHVMCLEQPLLRYDEGVTVIFGADSKGKITGIGNIKISTSPLIENVILVDGLKHNVLSIS